MDRALQLLGAKFCHDIASNINALGLILEMEADQPDAQNMHFAKQSHSALITLLDFYRILFGYRTETNFFTKVQKWIQHDSNRKNLSLVFPNESVMLNWASKTILCAYAILTENLIKDGYCEVQVSPTRWSVAVRALSYQPSSQLALLQTPELPQDISSTAALGVLAHTLAKQNNANIALYTDEQETCITFTV